MLMHLRACENYLEDVLPRFVDRVMELNWLRDWSSGFRYVPLYIYGPEGCGKTRLLKEFARKFS